jgi:hypothetical protein
MTVITDGNQVKCRYTLLVVLLVVATAWSPQY